MKITPLPGYFRSLEAQLEMDALVTELRRRNPPKPRPIKPDGMSEADFILSLQAPSTQRTMKMNDKELEEYRNRPLPANWLANPDAKTNDESVGMRPITAQELTLEEQRRRTIKNTLGQSENSSVSELGRERGIQGFLYTPPAQVTTKEVETKAVNLVEYKSEPLKEEWIELPWWKAILHKLKGNKIKVTNKA